MALRKAENAQVVKSGMWFWTEWRVQVSRRQFFRLGRRLLKQIEATDGPVAVGRDGRKTLWMLGDDFYWESDGMAADEVELLLWDRGRRQGAKIDRLRKLRVRAEDITTSRRERIPDDVKVHVWERDEGKCVNCGAEDALQFDHVIPVAKGGGNQPENIQLLCADCNQMKSDSIV